jgi:serine/threonine protein phosphatase PrpC
VTVLRSGAATDAGLVRHNNQDRLLVADTLVAVADGMGGHAGGEVASQLAITTLQEAFTARPEPHTAEDLVAAVEHANESVFEQSQADPSLRGMGTTLTAAALVVTDGEERIAIANVGDSRTYVFSQGDLTQLTEDHSVAEELVRQGQIAPEEVDTHPQRHILTRAMGIYPAVDTDLWEVLPFTGDRLVLCSDGLVREVSDEQIAAVLRRLADPTEAATELVARARAAGGSDNITVVVVNIVDDDDRSLTASEAIGATGHASDPLPPPPGVTEGDDGEAATFSASAPATVEPVAPLPRRPRRLTLRLIGFVILIGLIFAGGAIAVVTYARDSYFVTLGPPGPEPSSSAARPLLIYKGRPGGLLWFKPTLVQRTQVLSNQVLPSRLPDLQKGRQQPSLAAARTYVANLLQEAASTTPASPDLPTTSTSPSSTTTPP